MGNAARAMAEAVLAGSGLSAAKLGLRFDKVVVRVLGDLGAFADATLPEGVAAVVTLTAPIRAPAQTVDALAERIEALAASLSAGDFSGTVHGNAARVRLGRRSSATRPKLVGFVHNPDSDPDRLLGLAEHWLATPSAAHPREGGDP